MTAREVARALEPYALMTQREVARALGMSRSRVGQVEHAALAKIARALGARVETPHLRLLGGRRCARCGERGHARTTCTGGKRS